MTEPITIAAVTVAVVVLFVRLACRYLADDPGTHTRQNADDTQTSMWLAGLTQQQPHDLTPFPERPWDDDTGTWSTLIAAEEATP